MKFCPHCGAQLITLPLSGRERHTCPDNGCGFVHWNNPIPVVAAVVECDDSVLLVQNVGWPSSWFGLVTGFLESGEMPEQGVKREVSEEVGLDAKVESYIGMYEFFRKNELIIAYHLTVTSKILTLDKLEIAKAKWVPTNKVRPWNAGTGYALRDWLALKGISTELTDIEGAN